MIIGQTSNSLVLACLTKENRLKKQTNKAYNDQQGLCFYCKQPMWYNDPSEYASKFKISLRSANIFQCTGEHLIPHNEGGTSKQNNIVAACSFCNSQRHRRKKVLAPKPYYYFVQTRISKGRWNSGILSFEEMA